LAAQARRDVEGLTWVKRQERVIESLQKFSLTVKLFDV